MKKIAIVTGASSGMGKEFVLQLDQLAHHVEEIWVIARRTGKLFELDQQTEHKIVVCPTDLTKESDMRTFENLLKKEAPVISILVNAAGYGVHGSVADSEPGTTLGMIDVNCRALTFMTKLCLPYMAKGGRIINMASSAAFVPQPKFAVYAASKSYVLSFSRALHTELENRKISVTAVCPGPVDTEFFKHDDCDINQTFYKRMVMAKPEAVVKQALSDANSRRTVSVYGSSIKGLRILAKIVPHKWILGIMKWIL